VHTIQRVRIVTVVAVALFGLGVLAATGLAATSSVCRSGLATTAQGQTFYCENAGCPGSCSASGAPQGGEKKGTTGEMNCWCSALVFADGCGYLMTWAVVDDNGSIDWFWQGCQGPCPSPQNCLLGEGQVPGTDICECQ